MGCHALVQGKTATNQPLPQIQGKAQKGQDCEDYVGYHSSCLLVIVVVLVVVIVLQDFSGSKYLLRWDEKKRTDYEDEDALPPFTLDKSQSPMRH